MKSLSTVSHARSRRNKIWPVREHQNVSKCLHHRNYIASYLNYIATIGHKHAFGDAGLIQPPSQVATMGGKAIRKVPAGRRRQEPIWIFSKQPSYIACVTVHGDSIREKGILEVSYRAFSKYNIKIWR